MAIAKHQCNPQGLTFQFFIPRDCSYNVKQLSKTALSNRYIVCAKGGGAATTMHGNIEWQDLIHAFWSHVTLIYLKMKG